MQDKAFFEQQNTKKYSSEITAKWIFRNDPNAAANNQPTPFLALQITKINDSAINTTEDLFQIYSDIFKKSKLQVNETAVDESKFFQILEANKNPTGDPLLPHITVTTALDYEIIPRKAPQQNEEDYQKIVAQKKVIINNDFSKIASQFESFVKTNADKEFKFFLDTDFSMLVKSTLIPDGAALMFDNRKVVAQPFLSTAAAFTGSLKKNDAYNQAIEDVKQCFSAANLSKPEFVWTGPRFPLHTTLARISTEENKSTFEQLLKTAAPSQKLS